MRIAEELHLDVPRAHHELFEIDLVVAERRLCFAPRGPDFLRELGLAGDDAHAAPATAPARFEHDRIADFRREARSRGLVARQGRRRRHDWNACRDRELTRADLVA
jgi:hypothetical protein